jgi:hypothetical protein
MSVNQSRNVCPVVAHAGKCTSDSINGHGHSGVYLITSVT